MSRAGRSGRGRESRDPAPISDAVNRLVSERGWEERIALGRLRARWAEIVGEQVASRSEPIRLEDGRLTIRVEGGAWAAELALLGSNLARAAARFLGSEGVREVGVVAGSVGRGEEGAERRKDGRSGRPRLA
jgi:predicted nucleic acid-binding Zn ribbon protein